MHIVNLQSLIHTEAALLHYSM